MAAGEGGFFHGASGVEVDPLIVAGRQEKTRPQPGS
jgi:hypothetical protein